MPNTIELAKLYLSNLQKAWTIESLTAVLENGEMVRSVAGASAGEVKVPVMKVSGMKDYSRTGGYPAGVIDLKWKTLELAQDRGVKFPVDVMDNDESTGIVAGNMLSTFQTESVVPEIDAYRFAKIAQGSATANRATGSISTADGAFTALKNAVSALNNKSVPAEGRILFCTNEFYEFLKEKVGDKRFYMTKQADINTEIEMYDNMRIVRVPTTRFYTGWAKDDVNGGFTNDGSAINFLLVHKSAVLPVIKHNPIKVLTPEINQSLDAWEVMYRLYHDCFVLPNRENGVYVHSVSAIPVTSDES